MKKLLQQPSIILVIICLWMMNINTSKAQLDYKWQNPLPQGNGLRSVVFTDENTGIAVGYYGTILRTADGGVSWDIQSSGTTVLLWAVSFGDANTGVAVGVAGTILRTIDGGLSWIQQ